MPLAGMALTYFFVNTVPIAIAIALTTNQSAWRIWKTDFASSAPSYLLGAAAAAVVIAVTESSGYWLTLLLTAAPLYLTYKMYRAGARERGAAGRDSRSRARRHHHDGSAAEHPRVQPGGRADVRLRADSTSWAGTSTCSLPPADRRTQLGRSQRVHDDRARPARRPPARADGLRADGTEFPVELTVARIGGDSRAVITGFIRDITERRAARGAAAAVAEARSDRPARRRRRARLQQHPDEHHGLGRPDADAARARRSGARAKPSEIKQSVERGAGLTRQLLAFSRRQATRSRLFALGDVVRGMDTMLRRLIGPEIEFEIVCAHAAGRSIMADSGQIEQVVLNLVINARDAMPEGGRLTVRVEEVELDEAAALAFDEGTRRALRAARASPTPAPASTSRRARSCSSRSSRPRSKARARASACRSSTASSSRAAGTSPW